MSEAEDGGLSIPEVDAAHEVEQRRALSMRSDRLRSLGEMAAGIAHELNQPLVTVRGAAEHLLIGLEEGWDTSRARLDEKLNLIVEQADRMVHIIDHVRMFAREAGKPTLTPVGLNDVVESTTELIGVQFRSHGVELHTELTENLPQVYANPYSLEEVFLNLLINARDAVESQQERSPRVVVSTALASDGDHVCVSIEDNGTGIPADVMERIWDPFFTTKDPDRGTGLGLSISKSIIEGFDGHIQVETSPSEKTTISVILPVFEGDADDMDGST